MNLSQQLPDLTEVPESLIDEAIWDTFNSWTASKGINLYPAQEEASLGILAGDNVILATPTGSGKSMVANAAHFIALARGQRSFYTAPIKALVSEKFFALCEIFGAENVGMMTGDATVNGNAPIIAATAEIVANIALRDGAEANIDQVVMDEFHYYSDPDRGWAWQVPLLELPKAQFLLMSATLGDTDWLQEDLTRRTGRETNLVAGSTRPVPLDFSYVFSAVHETIEELLADNKAPIYVVHFSQREAAERAAEDEGVRAVVLSGAGKRFCGGGDIASFADSQDTAGDLYELAVAGDAAVAALEALAKPVAVAVHGAVAGAGLGIMLAGDVVIAAEGTKFVVAYPKIGLNPDCGTSTLLPLAMGRQRALAFALRHARLPRRRRKNGRGDA